MLTAAELAEILGFQPGTVGRLDPSPQLATIMGTSIRELEDTYHRWLRQPDERLPAPSMPYDLAARTAS